MEPVKITITAFDRENHGIRIDSDVPNMDMMLNMLAQATRWAEDQHREMIMAEHVQRLQDQQLANRLVRPS